MKENATIRGTDPFSTSETTGTVALREDDQLAGIAEQFKDDAKTAFLRVNPKAFHRLVSSLLSKRFLIATGLAGSGKTKLAQAFARWITPHAQALRSEPFVKGDEIKSARSTYTIVDCDDLSVVVLQPGENTKTILPLNLVDEWARIVVERAFTASTPSQEIQKAVAESTDWSPTINSFHSPLKALALHHLQSARPVEAGTNSYSVVPVGADWTGNENILGYPDGLQVTQYVAKPALDLILHAADHGDVPHFLILDEMNLSHVERYFADVLSIIESDEGLELYSGDMTKPETWRKTSAAKAVPPKLKQLPENLFIIGTVNVDETTYMFSPKVLDRANVIEFRMDAGELEGFLGNPAKPDLSKLDGKGAAFGKAFVDAAKNPVAVPSDVKAAYDAEMLLLFKTMQAHGAEFGYRTAYETARFIHFYKLLGNHPDGDATWFPGAFDCVVFQKLLPKLHGSESKLRGVLFSLAHLCSNKRAWTGPTFEDNKGFIETFAAEAIEKGKNNLSSENSPTQVLAEKLSGKVEKAHYPLSFDKIERMWRAAHENGFASFAES